MAGSEFCPLYLIPLKYCTLLFILYEPLFVLISDNENKGYLYHCMMGGLPPPSSPLLVSFYLCGSSAVRWVFVFLSCSFKCRNDIRVKEKKFGASLAGAK